MRITRNKKEDRIELALEGRMDAVWSDHVGQAIADCLREGNHAVDLDMTGVDYISSAGIRVLVTYHKQLQAISGRFAIVRTSEAVQQILKLAGMHKLLRIGETPSAVPALAAAQARPSVPATVTREGFEVYELGAKSAVRCRLAGNPKRALESGIQLGSCETVAFREASLGLGLGALGGESVSSGNRFGEFLAVAGAAVSMPADGANKPDFMLAEGQLVPEVKLAYGLVAEGGFSRLVRFQGRPEERGVRLSTIVETCLSATGSSLVAMAIAAETTALVGAAWQRCPGSSDASQGAESVFRFPGIREWLTFTAEPAYKDSVCLAVGFASGVEGCPYRDLLRPLRREGGLWGHFHAAAFPYRPVQKGRISLEETVHRLFENQSVLGVLHLLNDWREANGVGESLFLRGACWCAPVAI